MKEGDKIIFNKEKYSSDYYNEYHDKIFTVKRIQTDEFYKVDNDPWVMLEEIKFITFRCDLFLGLNEMRKLKLKKLKEI